MTPITLPFRPGRILIIKPSAIGDVVHALPVLNLLRRKWPEAHITWLVTPTCAGLVQNHPLLNETILFDRRGWATASIGALRGLWQFSRMLREKQFDLVIDLQGLLRSGWMSRTTKAPVRVGFANARELAPLFYTHRVPIHTMEQHAIERYLSVAEALGCPRAPVEFHFAVDEPDRASVRELLQTDEPYAVLMPGTNWITKRWPPDYFAAVIGPLWEQFGLRTVIAGGPGDAKLAEQVLSSTPTPGNPRPGDKSARDRVVDLVGRTNLRQTVALLERASLVLANDSGPMHIAAALGRPLVTPYGPTNPVRTGPFRRLDTVIRLDLPCSPCYSRSCSHISCIRWLTPEMILAQVSIALGR